MSSAAPGWEETSVRWLRTHHPRWVPATSRRPFNELLHRALMNMHFKKAVALESGWSQKEYEGRVRGLTDNWQPSDHEGMVNFLDRGGYTAPEVPVATAAEEAKFRVGLPDGTVDEFTIEGAEEVEQEDSFIDDDDNGPGPLVDRIKAAAGRRAAQKDLDEAVAAELAAQDPRFGAW